MTRKRLINSAAIRLMATTLLLCFAASAVMGETDLSVGWIARLPKIDYVWGSSNPGVEGWPTPGKQVTWVAHVRNLSDARVSSVGYRWLLNGVIISAGEAKLEPLSITTFQLPWTWKRARHQLVFEIDPANSLQETEERNNQLLIYTDALAVGFWVEQTFWDSIRAVVTRAGIGGTTFDDWMQRRIRQYNEMAALAKYPETPRGVMDRWRIDEIHVVHDRALPVSPLGDEVRDWGADPADYGTLYPDSKDRTVDMQWGFPARTALWYANHDAWPLMYDSLVHELGHARYLIDVYASNVSAKNDLIGIVPRPPSTQYAAFHESPEQGLMNTSWGYLDRYSAIALNRIAGHRATQGNYNEPSNIGSFLNDLPAMNRVRIVTPDGKIFPNRRVRIYRASSNKDPKWRAHPYRLKIDRKPDLEFITDSRGTIFVGRNPFTRDDVVIAVDQNNALAIVELVDGRTSHWGYLEARQFNLAYWRGKKDFAVHNLVVDEPVCFGTGIGPNNVKPYHEALVNSGNVLFEWSAPASPREFQLWYAVDGGKPVRVDVKPVSLGPPQLTIPLQGKRVAWWLVYKVDFNPPQCPAVRSSTFFFDLRSP